MEDYSVRRALGSDCGLLAQIGTETFIETFADLYSPSDLKAFLEENHSEQSYKELLADEAYAAWIGTHLKSNSTVGFAIAGPCTLPVEDMVEGAGEIKRLYIYSDHQSVGLGQSLMEAMLNWLKEQKYHPLYLSVYAENHGAQRFYNRYEFEKVQEYEFKVGKHFDPEYIFQQKKDI